ncbi:hypothetical protein EJ06DRAFT_553619 [Trichodelitschia bisporula]|uniref:STE3-domain-containing protein n=1 Tax=Trichodelitschia bisporula TaxID=703511 RepID=A0A6G1I9E0_9PEZI|nr:hypothetical protein EJ06DRAFT_553619 [Trichodelitschia bisporula]
MKIDYNWTHANLSDLTYRSWKVYMMAVLCGLALMMCVYSLLFAVGTPRNSTVLILLVFLVLLNFIGFINAIIWPDDDLMHWYNGEGLCDIEVYTMVFLLVALPASAMCIMRWLCKVVNPDHAINRARWGVLGSDKIFNGTCCIAFPALIAASYYSVQLGRYEIHSITGCEPARSITPATIGIVLVWPLVLSLMALGWAALLVFRLYRHYSQFTSILSQSSTTPSAFIRMFLMASSVIFSLLPPTIGQLITFSKTSDGVKYDWDLIHKKHNTAHFIATGGSVANNRWTWPIFAFISFALFGLTQRQRELLMAPMRQVFDHLLRHSGAASAADRFLPGWLMCGRRQSQPAESLELDAVRIHNGLAAAVHHNQEGEGNVNGRWYGANANWRNTGLSEHV